VISDVYANDVDKALQKIDQVRADLLARRSARAVLVS